MKKRVTVVSLVLAFVASSCIGGTGGPERTVLVDYKHDQFGSTFLGYFPNIVQAHPGDTVVFRQAWTGEPHSVTMGTKVDELGRVMKPLLKAFAKGGYDAIPPEAPKPIEKLEKILPWMVTDDGKAAQNGAQPCFLESGLPPTKIDTACTKAQQRQPAFTGRQTYFNSGFIPYAGPNGDTYTVKVAASAKPGEHFFYCNYHGEFMSGFLQIKPKSVPVPSQGTVAKEANREIDAIAKPLLDEYKKTSTGTLIAPPDAKADLERLGFTQRRGGRTYFRGWLAGDGADGVDNAQINAFIPSHLTARVGQKLTWVMVGGHTISFNVPSYFPIVTITSGGKVERNPKIDPPAGGAPKPPAESNEPPTGPPKPLVMDGGSWNGRGFWSTGLIFSDTFTAYSLRITRPGTYKFACLIHPPMVGTLVVR